MEKELVTVEHGKKGGKARSARDALPPSPIKDADSKGSLKTPPIRRVEKPDELDQSKKSGTQSAKASPNRSPASTSPTSPAAEPKHKPEGDTSAREEKLKDPSPGPQKAHHGVPELALNVVDAQAQLNGKAGQQTIRTKALQDFNLSNASPNHDTYESGSYQQLPDCALTAPDAKEYAKPPLVNIYGPLIDDESERTVKHIVCGRTISTYPIITARNGMKQPTGRCGDPICDRFSLMVLQPNHYIFAVTDGCNWGPRPLEASERANKAFVKDIHENLTKITDVRAAGRYLLLAVSKAQAAILEGKDENETGCTTLLGGVVIPLKKPAASPNPNRNSPGSSSSSAPSMYALVCVNVGDCKVFHWAKATGAVTDITEGNRLNLKSAKDPGGRLGSYKDGRPDLRNLKIYFHLISAGDLVFAVSDGVHDNLDPQQLGLMPAKLKLGAANWAEVPEDECFLAKKAFQLRLLNLLIPGAQWDPSKVTNKLLKHSYNVTKRTRVWMEQNPTKKEPSDISSFPGKMDHTTCLSFAIPEKDLSEITDWEEKKRSKRTSPRGDGSLVSPNFANRPKTESSPTSPASAKSANSGSNLIFASKSDSSPRSNESPSKIKKKGLARTTSDELLFELSDISSQASEEQINLCNGKPLPVKEKRKIANPLTNCSLHSAIRAAKKEDFTRLLAQCDVDERDTQQRTPLHIAVIENQRSMLEALIEEGAAINARDKTGWTPFHWACDLLHIDLCEILVRQGCEVQTLSLDGYCPIYNLIGGIKCDESPKASRTLNLLATMLEKGANASFVNSTTHVGLVHQACLLVNPHSLSLLLKRNAPVNIVNENGETPLHYAIMSGEKELVQLLLEHGADATIKTNRPSPYELSQKLAQSSDPNASEILLLLKTFLPKFHPPDHQKT